jgi:hypothetical protein
MGAYGNMAAIDAFLVGTSAATVTGLATFGSSPSPRPPDPLMRFLKGHGQQHQAVSTAGSLLRPDRRQYGLHQHGCRRRAFVHV